MLLKTIVKNGTWIAAPPLGRLLDANVSRARRNLRAASCRITHLPGTKIGDGALYCRGGVASVWLSMDILAAMLAYVVCVTGIVGALVISVVIFFSSPQAQPSGTQASQAMAMVAEPGPTNPVTTLAAASAATSTTPANIAADVRQKPLLTAHQLRRLAERERARRLAFREGLSFEDRFLHYAD